MPEATESDALILAKRIQDMILRWNKQETTPGLTLSISIGVSEAGTENIESLLSQADKDLYQCKVFRKKPEELTSTKELQRYLWHNVEN